MDPNPDHRPKSITIFRLSILRLLFDTPRVRTQDHPVTNRELYHFAHDICNIRNIYEPLKHVIMRHDTKTRLQVKLIPIVISRTGNFHTRTLAEIPQLVSFKENPRDKKTYKSLQTQAQTVAMAIHVHAQEWLTFMSKVSRSTLTQRKKTTKHTTTNNNDN